MSPLSCLCFSGILRNAYYETCLHKPADVSVYNRARTTKNPDNKTQNEQTKRDLWNQWNHDSTRDTQINGLITV